MELQNGGGDGKRVQKKIQKCKEALCKFISRRDVRGIQMYNEARWEYLNLLEKQEVVTPTHYKSTCTAGESTE